MNKAAEVGVNDIGLDKTMEEEIPDSMSTFTDDISSDDNSEGGTRGARVPPLFLDQNEAQRAEKTLFEATPPPPPTYLEVWIHHWASPIYLIS